MDENIGKKFGEWEVLKAVKDERPGKYYECQCSCGKVQNVHWVSMKLGRTKRCWDCGRVKTSKSENMIGKKFGDWLVLSVAGKKFKSYTYICRCICGREFEVYGPHLTRKKDKSTKCRFCSNQLKAALNIEHGYSNTSTYKIWCAMLSRCNNPKATHYHRYGGRGIKVCDRWREFRNFLKDMGERPEKMDLDRINNDGNYEPSNCRWISHRENCLNTNRKKKST